MRTQLLRGIAGTVLALAFICVALSGPACAADKNSLDWLLFDAARRGDAEEVTTLLAEGADVNAVDDMGWPVLVKATFNGRREVVKVLLMNGADTRAKDDKGATGLMWAAWRGHDRIVRLHLGGCRTETCAHP